MTCNHCHTSFPFNGTTIHMISENVATMNQWQQRQLESLSRYSDESYNADTTIPDLFAGFIGVTLPDSPIVLDVGCGIAPDLPPYARGLRASYIGLEPLDVPVNRSYTCISGAVAESLPFADGVLDAVVFATSLDHIQDVPKALGEIRRVLRDQGHAYFWVGLHDADLLFRSHSLYGVFFEGSLLRRAAKMLTAQIVLAKFATAAAVRQLRLRQGKPLDDIHFHYFTRASLRNDLTNAELSIAREIIVPGSNSAFLDCTPGN